MSTREEFTVISKEKHSRIRNFLQRKITPQILILVQRYIGHLGERKLFQIILSNASIIYTIHQFNIHQSNITVILSYLFTILLSKVLRMFIKFYSNTI